MASLNDPCTCYNNSGSMKTIIIACTKVFKRGNSDGKITSLMKKKENQHLM